MNAKELATALKAKRSGNQWVCKCVAHDDRNPSMIIFEGKTGAVQVRCLAGCDPLDIIAALKAMGLWAGSGRDDDISIGLEELRKEDPNRNHDRAMEIWEQGVDPAGTPGQEYLRNRGLELPQDVEDVVRYHSDCRMIGTSAPALIVLMRDVVTFEPRAIQRIFLEQGLTWTKTRAMMLGPVGNAAMMLSPWDEVFAGREPEEGPVQLCVAEGFETALALHNADVIPIWALGSAGAMARFPVIDGVAELIICADNDESHVGLLAAVECSDRWKAAGRQAHVKMPPEPGTDFADRPGASHG